MSVTGSAPSKKLTERLLVYSSFRQDQALGYIEAFKRLIAEFGEKRVEQGLSRAMDNSPDFPPTPAMIRGNIPRDNAPRKTCPRCVEIEGYVFVDKYSVRLCDHAVQP